MVFRFWFLFICLSLFIENLCFTKQFSVCLVIHLAVQIRLHVCIWTELLIRNLMHLLIDLTCWEWSRLWNLFTVEKHWRSSWPNSTSLNHVRLLEIMISSFGIFFNWRTANLHGVMHCYCVVLYFWLLKWQQRFWNLSIISFWES